MRKPWLRANMAWTQRRNEAESGKRGRSCCLALDEVQVQQHWAEDLPFPLAPVRLVSDLASWILQSLTSRLWFWVQKQTSHWSHVLTSWWDSPFKQDSDRDSSSNCAWWSLSIRWPKNWMSSWWGLSYII